MFRCLDPHLEGDISHDPSKKFLPRHIGQKMQVGPINLDALPGQLRFLFKLSLAISGLFLRAPAYKAA